MAFKELIVVFGFACEKDLDTRDVVTGYATGPSSPKGTPPPILIHTPDLWMADGLQLPNKPTRYYQPRPAEGAPRTTRVVSALMFQCLAAACSLHIARLEQGLPLEP